MHTAEIRLISWNVNNRSKHWKEQISALNKGKPDLVALQEVNRRIWPELKKAFEESGLKSIASFDSRGYGLAIASRRRLRALPRPRNLPFSASVLSALVSFPRRDIELHTVHIPNGNKHGWKKVRTLEAVYKHLARPCSRHRILCGDFNAPQAELDGRIITWGQRIRGSGKATAVAKWGVRWDSAERKVLQGLGGYDLKDVFRWLHGYSARRKSWRRYRMDHVFASDSLRPASCGYLREEKLSDHSAIHTCFWPRH